MLIDALHAALVDRIAAFDGVGCDGSCFDKRFAIGARLVGNFVPVANVFFFAVVDCIVASEVCADFRVDVGFIRHEATFAVDILANDRGNLSNRRGVNMEATCAAAALDKSKNRALVR